MMHWFPYLSGWLNADGTAEIIQSDDAIIDKDEISLEILKRILSSYCEKLNSRTSQSTGQKKKEVKNYGKYTQ